MVFSKSKREHGVDYKNCLSFSIYNLVFTLLEMQLHTRWILKNPVLRFWSVAVISSASVGEDFDCWLAGMWILYGMISDGYIPLLKVSLTKSHSIIEISPIYKNKIKKNCKLNLFKHEKFKVTVAFMRCFGSKKQRSRSSWSAANRDINSEFGLMLMFNVN